MAVIIQSIEISDKQSEPVVIKGRVEHHTPGREGTRLWLPLEIERRFGETTARLSGLEPKVSGEGVEATEQALDKLAEWLERAAKGIRQRGKATPVLSTYENDGD
jgi:hypothetical protein